MRSESLSRQRVPSEPSGPPLSGVMLLIIEDEASIAQLVRLFFEQAGATVRVAMDGIEGIKLFEQLRPDFVILDLMLPGLDGWDVCRRIREVARTPILMLTARLTEDDRIRGLDLGADDYVTKPFSPRELVSRVRAILRRAAPDAPVPLPRLDFPGLVIFPEARRVEAWGKPVELTAKEFDLLLALASAPGRVLSRQALLSQVWGFDFLGDSRTVDVHVGTVRKKLERAAPGGAYISTVRGAGYRFDPEGGANEAG